MGGFKEPVLNKNKIDDLYAVIDGINSTISKYGSINTKKAAIDLKHALNKFMPDYDCGEAYISNNTDKPFFGIFIERRYQNGICFIPDMRDIEEKSNDYYYFDLDTKLFTIGLTSKQILSLVIYDIYKILSNEATMDVVSAIDAICAGRNDDYKSLSNDNPGTQQLLNLCISDYLYRRYSICANSENELIRMHDIMIAYDLELDFQDAVNALYNANLTIGKDKINPALPLNWVFSILSRYTRRSTEALDVLNDFISTSGSDLIKYSATIIAKHFTTVYDKDVKKVLGEASLFSNIRKSGMRSLENDLFEYEMRVKNIDDENSAIFLMRQINSRMSIIQDYLEEEKLSDSEMKRWQALYDRYNQLRIKMTNKPIYSRKMYGLFTDYNALMQPGAENIMTMRTVY